MVGGLFVVWTNIVDMSGIKIDYGGFVGATSQISDDDNRALNTTLMDLLECKRLLDQAR